MFYQRFIRVKICERHYIIILLTAISLATSASSEETLPVKVSRSEESNDSYDRSTRIKFSPEARSLCKCISSCLTRSKRVLLRAFYRIPIPSSSTSNRQEGRGSKRERKKARE